MLLSLQLGAVVLSAQWESSQWRHLDARFGFPNYESGHQMIQDSLGRIWMTYENGLHCFDGSEVRRFTQDLTTESSLPEDNVRAIYLDRRQHLWISTMNYGLVVMDPHRDSFRRILPVSKGGKLPAARIWDILEDSEGILWFAARNGLVSFDRQDSTYHHYVYASGKYNAAQLAYFRIIRTIAEDPLDSTRLYCGTRSGLFSFDKTTGIFTRHRIPSKGKTALEPLTDEYMIMDLLFTSDSTLWMGSWGGGILKYNTISGVWKQYRDDSVVDENEIIWRIRQRNDRSLWVAAARSMAVLYIGTGEYAYADHTVPVDYRGLQFPNDFYFIPDSTLLIHGRQGLFVDEHYPGYDRAGEYFPPILTGIQVNDRDAEVDSVPPYLCVVRLDEEQNDLSFKVAWPVYREPENVEYAFWLKGEDSGWKDNGSSRIIQYTNLSGGHYALHYRARRPGQSWIEGVRPLQFTVVIPFWKSWVFLAGCTLGLVILVYFLYRHQIRQVRQKQEMESAFERRLATQEMATLRAQMNPHFIFNSLNAIKNYILKENTDEASMYLTKFSQLMRAVLRNSADALVTLEEEIRTLKLYIELESIRFTDKFEYNIEVEEDIDSGHVMVPPLLIQPYVENAIRHGLLPKKTGSRVLTISVMQDRNENLTFIVQDNGIGRQQSAAKSHLKSKDRKSFGMQITRDRIELIQETLGIDTNVEITDLFDYDGKPKGTRVTVTIPASKPDLISEVENTTR